ncbi:hypothetical protein [Legionella bononiensis]|nr:hypothetical protein [Legionella bononiensis]MBL7480378.1 hypothetical protein [Legionella bononiensis]
MNIKKILNFWVSVTATCLLSIAMVHANTQLPILISPTTSTTIQNPNSGITIIEYLVTNQMKSRHTFAMKPMGAVTQNTSAGRCGNPFVLQPGASCLLSLKVNRDKLSDLIDGPTVCVTKSPSDNSPGSYICTQASQNSIPRVLTIDPKFPYGSAPTGNVCVSSDYYATPETMLGSWAMIQAVTMDAQGNVLPSFLSGTNTVYAVGTAALGDQLGIPGCSGGCNQLNGFCFALKFNGKTPYPYMIFQSVNTGATPNTFDIYMAGGGSGNYPTQCPIFWGTGGNVNWGDHIESSSCSAYFGDYSSINSTYSVTYNGTAYPAKTTLQNACNFASAGQSGFNTQNWSNVSVVPVTCPTSLIQITGVELPASITTVGNQTIHNLSTLTDSDFAASTITPVTTTQMQDCKTPSSGYCSNVAVSVPNYQASISANLTAPLLTGTPPSSTYCQSNPGTSYCSWNNGTTSAGGSYCNANQSQCINCGGGSQWCICNGQTLTGCSS